MINFDFKSTVYNASNNLLDKSTVYSKFNTYDMIGWDKSIDFDITDMKRKVEEVKEISDVLVVIGIGGSYLGSKAIYDMFSSYFDKSFRVIYCGNSLSSSYLNDLKKELDKVNFSVNVISKSGNTMEIKLAYNFIKKYMEERYSSEEVANRIIMTTGEEGYLREEVNKFGYYNMSIPNDIGGRYSMFTPAHLFPLMFNIDIDKFINGYNDGVKLKDIAYDYACVRKSLFDNRKYVENFVCFEEKFNMFNEWLKQLFGESEGKNNSGILPTSTVFTRDLHSLGQFIQEGNKILFETFIVVRDNPSFMVDDKDINSINNSVIDAVRSAHYNGGVSVNLIEIDKLNEYDMGSLVRFFFYAAAFSSILFGVNPFDQPGVEVYKSEVRKRLENV